MTSQADPARIDRVHGVHAVIRDMGAHGIGRTCADPEPNLSRLFARTPAA